MPSTKRTPFGELLRICHKSSSCGFVTVALLIHILRIICSCKLHLHHITAPVFILPFSTPVHNGCQNTCLFYLLPATRVCDPESWKPREGTGMKLSDDQRVVQGWRSGVGVTRSRKLVFLLAFSRRSSSPRVSGTAGITRQT